MPEILAGPIVRRVDAEGATVWVAVRRAGPVRLEVYEDQGGRPGAQVLAGEAATVRIGERLHLAAVTARPAGAPLVPGREYLYDLKLADGRGLGDDGVLVDAVAQARPVERLCYPGRSLPGLRRFAEAPLDVHFAHGSCRKPHGKGPDALAFLDAAVARAYADGAPPPQALLLTGDQIYADDVHPELLGRLLAALPELVGVDGEARVDLAPLAPRLLPGQRQALMEEQAGFTSGEAACHLVTFAEYAAMYLFAWSDVPWRLGGPPGEALAGFVEALPAARRVLANVPVWMQFDDHDVTDDWNRTGRWVERVARAPLGHRVVRNALAAYALFQHWGNDPAAFAADRPGGALLAAVHGWDGRAGAQADAVAARIHLPARAEDAARPPEGVLRWEWSVDAPAFRVLAPDCRTRRAYDGPDHAPALLAPEARAELFARGGRGAFTVLVAPTPLLGERLFEQVQRVATWLDVHRPAEAAQGRLADLVDCEAWGTHRPTFEAMVEGLAGWGETLLLSGDVHYGYAATLAGDGVRVVNLTASSLKNRSFPGLLMRLLQAGADPLHAPAGAAPLPAPPPVAPEALGEPRTLTVGGRVLVETVGSDAGEPDALAGPAEDARRGDVLGDPNVALVRFLPGKVEQRLLHGAPLLPGAAPRALRHLATFLAPFPAAPPTGLPEPR